MAWRRRRKDEGHYWWFFIIAAVVWTLVLTMTEPAWGQEGERLYAELGGDSAATGSGQEKEGTNMANETGPARRVYTASGIKDYPGTDPVIRDLLAARALLTRIKWKLECEADGRFTGMAEDIAHFLENGCT